jgi:hypothetical protein
LHERSKDWTRGEPAILATFVQSQCNLRARRRSIA